MFNGYDDDDFYNDPFLYDEDLENEGLHEENSRDDQAAIKHTNKIILTFFFLFAVFWCIIISVMIVGG